MQQPQDSDSLETSKKSIVKEMIYAIGSTTSILVSATFFLVLAYRRDAFMSSFFVGSISNGILSKLLKRILDQERPEDIKIKGDDLPGDKGMPSSHAMSLGFIGTFTALHIPETAVPLVVYVWVSLYYRWQTQLHTREQLLVGLVVGSTNAVVWNQWGQGPVMDFVSQYLVNNEGVLPWPLLAVPAGVGAIVVGSVERKLRKWWQKQKES